MGRITKIISVPLLGLGAGLCLAAEAPPTARESVETLVEIVRESSAVVSFRNEIVIADWRVRQQVAADAPQVTFSTTGKLPIADSVSDSSGRVSDLDRRYLDGIFQLTKPLYDWGRNESLVQASEFRKKSAVQKYEMMFEEQLARLISLSLDYLKVEDQGKAIRRDVEFLSQTLVAVRQRYQAGAGSLEDVRKLELRRIDLERDLERAQNEQTRVTDTMRKLFSVAPPEIRDPVLDALKLLPAPRSIDISVPDLMASRSAELEQRAIDYEIAGVVGEKRPAVKGTLTTRLYNVVTNPLEEYEIYGGLNVEFPVFDGGARDAQIAGLNAQKVLVRSRLREELDKVDERWYRLSSDLTNTAALIEQDERRLVTLGERLDGLKKRLEAVQVTIVDIAEAELARTQAVRSISSQEWGLLNIAVQKADAADKLVSIYNVELPL